ncbi:LPS export ABC transporter periplasmic protein LptC [Sandaracinobacteroides saxicola]|uniref:LPS export ABC transporter periplasmic protein LptC n=1 Tax=Sandaracinobacteroides saxicola TaxID=2759707 RepID=A0A7G5ILU9_9SPHN|nr:LPS export ABC transporter periplasmic protein LptC [Sandaracinobacteroides saxicola]QMW24341.1 LPS export ABC transporter periplasmic protein LptC [Sandaracinobacteroides saxicola]
MTELAAAQRNRRRVAAMPGGTRDRMVAVAKLGFPLAAIFVLGLLLALPLFNAQEFSFLLSKDSAGQANERMRIEQAMYRGETSDGKPFEISAADAVQKTSDTPVVMLKTLRARVQDNEGPATVTAPAGLYDMDSDVVEVSGPVKLDSASGFALDSDTVQVNLRGRTVTTKKPVTGRLPMGTFAANSLYADIQGKRVVLEGNARLRIIPARGRGAA